MRFSAIFSAASLFAGAALVAALPISPVAPRALIAADVIAGLEVNLGPVLAEIAALKNTVEGVTEAAVTPLLQEVVSQVQNATESIKDLAHDALTQGNVMGDLITVLNKVFTVAGPAIAEAEKIPGVKEMVDTVDVTLGDLLTILGPVVNGLLGTIAALLNALPFHSELEPVFSTVFGIVGI